MSRNNQEQFASVEEIVAMVEQTVTKNEMMRLAVHFSRDSRRRWFTLKVQKVSNSGVLPLLQVHVGDAE